MQAYMLDTASAAVATSLAAVALGTAAYLSSRKRKHDDVVERGLPAMPAAAASDAPAPKAKRARTTKTHEGLAVEASIVDLLKRRATETPDKVVYVFLDDAGKESVVMTFADVDRAARRVAATLQQDASLKKGDRVMLCYPPGLDFAMGFWGCLYAGAIGIPVYPPYPGTLAKDLPKFNRMVDDSGAKVILTNRAYYMATQLATAKSYFSGSITWPKDIQWFSTDAISAAMADRYEPVECTFDDIAFFQYSSGSTSEPKAVMISHGNIHAQLKTWASIREDDTMVSWLPSYHDMGLVGFILVPCSTGARCISMSPLAFIKDPALWMRTVSKYKGTHVCAPNFGYALAARKTSKTQVAKLDLRSLKQCICAAEPIRIESLEAFTDKFLPAGFNPKTFNCGYGLAEVTLVVTGQDPYKLQDPTVLVLKKSALEQKKTAVVAPKGHNAVDTCTLVGCGIPMPTFRVIVVDPETHVQLKDNAVGEIWIQGPSVAKGYWHRDEYTKEQFQATLKDPKRKRESVGSSDKSHFLRSGDVTILDKSHWLRSGDMGFLRNGQTFVTGRLKDLIIVRGRNVCPQDVEHTAELAHDEVRPGCVAAFSIETSNQEEALVVVAEMRSDLKKDQDKLRAIANAIATSVLSEHQLRCASIVLLRPRSIPKTTSGKIQRRGTKAKFEDNTLAAQYTHTGIIESRPKHVAEPEVASAENATEASSTPAVIKTPDEIVAWLLERLAQENNEGGTSSEDAESQASPAPAASNIDADTPWACVGMDSVAIVGLSAELGEFLGCVVPPSAFFQFDTPAKLANAPGLATGELETQESTLPEGSYVDENGEIKAECYDFECFPEVQHLRGQLTELTDAGLVLPYLDVLTAEKKQQLNFNTYNYLGYASHPATAQASKDAIDNYGTGMSSSPIVGQNIINTQLEAALCKHFDAEASVLFVGGWVTNVTTIAALVGKGDLILAFFYDACVAAKLDVGTNVRGACVVVVYIGGTVETVRLSMRLSDEEKINVKPIVHPAVEEGKCRLRFFISYLHTEADLSRTVESLVRIMGSLRSPDAIVEATTKVPTPDVEAVVPVVEAAVPVVEAVVPVVEPVVDNQTDANAPVEEPQHEDSTASIEKVAEVTVAVVEAAPVELEVQTKTEVPAPADAVSSAPLLVDEAPKTFAAEVPETVGTEAPTTVVEVEAASDAEPKPKAKKATKKKTAKKTNAN
ncbi:hypothetical protein SPRG_20618 [Saprolegnia parasitica CBS 223.65]|uniref:Carrier domain-containing protein n=1 Tax=Saprolegnia parasitica (strain CBS 223.65) TaxID=695850 RepID=A0A067C5L3_SAPPC|nr:hypothetical protein SPRG_20618 [Saprolegnia parasitica CBS 223.65]KDO26059.1 hypothetical protein SPRG_20618 [Saprolegnia parasitica CBS 223.65]|eukprot:XP_012203357.1 hypothetical protein SPRG_20618 [Saprolegnia parasitica CBS 223.65]